jgi:hypothetical protein
MLRSTVTAFFALTICSDALAITLVPVPFTSILQIVSVDTTVTDPTDAVNNWSDPTGMGTSEAKVAAGALQLSNQGTLTGGSAPISEGHDLQFVVPDFGSGTTAIVFTITQVSSQLSSGVIGGGETVGDSPGIYRSAILGDAVVSLPSPLQIGNDTQFGTTAATEDFLAGDTVRLSLGSSTEYTLVVSPGTYSETFTVQAFAVEPTPEPSTSALVSVGLLTFGFGARAGRRK